MVSPDQKSGSEVLYREFSSLEEKYRILMSECRGIELRGGPINEMLTFGGSRRMLWVDLDTRDWSAFRQWESSSGFPFAPDSYRAIPSSSGKVHIYVVVDRILTEMQCWEYCHLLRRGMPEHLAPYLDRVYGPTLPLPVYLPLAHTGDPIMPQDLVKDCQAVTVIGKAIGPTLWERWLEKRNAKST